MRALLFFVALACAIPAQVNGAVIGSGCVLEPAAPCGQNLDLFAWREFGGTANNMHWVTWPMGQPHMLALRVLALSFTPATPLTVTGINGSLYLDPAALTCVLLIPTHSGTGFDGLAVHYMTYPGGLLGVQLHGQVLYDTGAPFLTTPWTLTLW